MRNRFPGLREAANRVMENSQITDDRSTTGMINEDTRQEVLEASAWSLAQDQGRMNDYGEPKRPWLFILCGTRDEGSEIREALGYVGFVKKRRDGLGWKYGAYGNDALVVLEELAPYMEGHPRERALGLLDKWGKEGKPYTTEYERIRALGHSSTDKSLR